MFSLSLQCTFAQIKSDVIRFSWLKGGHVAQVLPIWQSPGFILFTYVSQSTYICAIVIFLCVVCREKVVRFRPHLKLFSVLLEPHSLHTLYNLHMYQKFWRSARKEFLLWLFLKISAITSQLKGSCWESFFLTLTKGVACCMDCTTPLRQIVILGYVDNISHEMRVFVYAPSTKEGGERDNNNKGCQTLWFQVFSRSNAKFIL